MVLERLRRSSFWERQVDVCSPHGGKKNRPVTSFRLLADPSALDEVQRACFSETSTIGLRWRNEERRTLDRRETHATISDGTSVRVKEVVQPTGRTMRKIECDELRAIDGLRARRARKAQAEQGSE